MADEADMASELQEQAIVQSIKNAGNSYSPRTLVSCTGCDGYDYRIRQGFTLCEECFNSVAGC